MQPQLYAMPDGRYFFAPGRVNLIGEHTDYTGGLVLPVAIGLGITLEARRVETSALVSEDFPGDRSWQRYVDAVAAELEVSLPLSGTVRSTLPAGAGLSSSAALEVAVALALCALSGKKLPKLDLIEATRRAEERAVGVPCGLMDQAVAVLGQAGKAVLIDTSTLEYRYVEIPEEIELVVLDSGVRRRLQDSRYAMRRAEVESGDPRRLRHIATENARVEAAVTALDQRDMAPLGRLFRESHNSLRDDFDVSVPELDSLVDRAYRHGAIAARMTGGGFGGTVISLVYRGSASAFVRDIDPVRAWIVTAADGAREITP